MTSTEVAEKAETPEDMMDTLKACPFCDGDASLISERPDKSWPCYVSCNRCSAMTRSADGDEAVEAWNTRPTVGDELLREALEEARTAIADTLEQHKEARNRVPDEEEGLAAQIFCQHINWTDGPLIDAMTKIDAALARRPLVEE